MFISLNRRRRSIETVEQNFQQLILPEALKTFDSPTYQTIMSSTLLLLAFNSWTKKRENQFIPCR